MQRCEICNGRLISAPEGNRCMNPNCEGAKNPQGQQGTLCRCGQPMMYKGLNSWGEPNYACPVCGTTAKL